MNWGIFRKTFIPLILLAVILLPCLIEAFKLPLGNVGTEQQHSLFMFSDIPLQYRFDPNSTGFGDVEGFAFTKKSLGFDEGGPVDSGGFVEFGYAEKLHGVPIVDQSPKKDSNDTEPTSDKCYFVGTKIQFRISLLLVQN